MKALETVGVDGEELEGSGGRLVNPGHIIEAGWFLIQYATCHVPEKTKSKAILQLGIDISNWAFTIGWDPKYQGILYFIDAGGEFSPMQLEWDMKLWWPHTEAMITFLMAF